MISVLLGRMPGKVESLKLKEGTTLAELLTEKAAHETGQVRVCGQPQDGSYVLHDGDVVLILYPVRGEATFKWKGKIWLIHKYDADTVWPSDFHMHNKQVPEVLDLYTGRVYHKVTKNLIGSLKRKDHLGLLVQLEKRGFPFPDTGGMPERG